MLWIMWRLLCPETGVSGPSLGGSASGDATERTGIRGHPCAAGASSPAPPRGEEASFQRCTLSSRGPRPLPTAAPPAAKFSQGQNSGLGKQQQQGARLSVSGLWRRRAGRAPREGAGAARPLLWQRAGKRASGPPRAGLAAPSRGGSGSRPQTLPIVYWGRAVGAPFPLGLVLGDPRPPWFISTSRRHPFLATEPFLKFKANLLWGKCGLGKVTTLNV